MKPYHIPALLKESILGLNINPDGVYVDATYGGGGHSKEILKHLKKGVLIAFDQDADTLKNKVGNPNFHLIHSNFRYMKNFLNYHGISKVDGILADLGISFHQVDEKNRGFSFNADNDLDMRMNTKSNKTAADILNNYTEEKLLEIFKLYGDLKNAHQIVNEIINQRKQRLFKNTAQFVDSLRKFTVERAENKFFAKVFQALRIELNQEIEALKDFLEASSDLIKKGGRLAILSYHSKEDRIVKNFIKAGNFSGDINKDIYGNFDCPFKAVNKKVIVPDYQEIKQNSRARSAKLRVAERI